MRCLVAFAALASGCGGNGIGYGGQRVWDLFPFDGQRSWTYLSTDTTLAYALVATSSGEPEPRDGTNVYTVVSAADCVGADPGCVDGEISWKVQWSSDSGNGVLVHGSALGDGPVDELSPPVRVAMAEQVPDEPLETTTAGATWTATFLGTDACPIRLSAAWDCGLFEIAVDVGDGAPLAGRWWATKSHGIAAMELAGESGRWELSDEACEGDCDGDW